MKSINFPEEGLAPLFLLRGMNRPPSNQSLGGKSGKEAGGQPGHEGKTPKCSTVIDTIVEHVPAFCNCCSKDLKDIVEGW